MAISADGVARFRQHRLMVKFPWIDIVSSLEGADRLKFPIKGKLGDPLINGLGMGRAALMDAVLEYCHAVSLRGNGAKQVP